MVSEAKPVTTPRPRNDLRHRIRRSQGRGALGVALPVLAAAALALSACAGDVPAAPADDAQLVLGREVYASNCQACHGADGGGATGPRLNDGVMELNYPDPADAFTVIANGKDRMPAFSGKLSDEEIEAVVRFTREGL